MAKLSTMNPGRSDRSESSSSLPGPHKWLPLTVSCTWTIDLFGGPPNYLDLVHSSHLLQGRSRDDLAEDVIPKVSGDEARQTAWERSGCKIHLE